jgi:LPXTG-motif cell wall-anchored protein
MSADQVQFLGCQINRVLTAMSIGAVPVGDLIDDNLVRAAVVVATFADKYPQIQPAKVFDVYKPIVDFLASPDKASLEAARGALNAILSVVAEYEGVESECGAFDVNIQGVWPPPAPLGGTDVLKPLAPVPVLPGTGLPGFNLPVPSTASSRFWWLLLGGAVIGTVGGVVYARRKRDGRGRLVHA